MSHFTNINEKTLDALSFDLVNKSQKAREKDYLSYNYRAILALLPDEPIVFLDIGAGEQADPIVKKYDGYYFSSISGKPRYRPDGFVR